MADTAQFGHLNREPDCHWMHVGAISLIHNGYGKTKCILTVWKYTKTNYCYNFFSFIHWFLSENFFKVNSSAIYHIFDYEQPS